MKMMNRYTSRLAALLTAAVVLLSASAAHAADEHAAAADKVGRFLMVLRQPGARGNGKEVKEPDVAPLGGKVIGRGKNGVVIDLPLPALKRLRDDENVAIVQRIWMGEPLETWAAEAAAAEPDAPVSSSRLRALETATAATWSSGDYAYDPSGNITAIGTNSYFYDTAQRLISSSTSGVNETYRYDSFGNLAEKTIAGRAAGSIAVDPGSNRLTGIEYDVAGNQLTDSSRAAAYTYDSVGMLVKAVPPQGGSPTRMIYTADDERIGTLVDANTAYWRVRDFTSSQVLREWMSDGGSAWFWNEDFIYADGHLVAGERETYYGGKRHFTLDHLGSVRMVTRTDKTRLQSKEFLPFGVERTPSNQELVNLGYTATRPEPMNFAGHERDFRGAWDTDNSDYLDDMHARYYNPNVGRFLSVDPDAWYTKQNGTDDEKREFQTNLRRPQGWNRYSYAYNNPTRYTDPDGKVVVVDDAAIALFILGSAAFVATEAYLQSPNANDPSHTNAQVMAANVNVMGSQIRSSVTGVIGTIMIAQNNRQTGKVANGLIAAALTELGKVTSAGGPGKDPDFDHHKREIKAMLDRAVKLAKRLPGKVADELLKRVRDIGNGVGLEY